MQLPSLLVFMAALAALVDWRATIPWWHVAGNLLLAAALAWSAWRLVRFIRRNRAQVARQMGARYPTLYWFYAGRDGAIAASLVVALLIDASSPLVAVLRILAALGAVHTGIVLDRTQSGLEIDWRSAEGQAAIADIRTEAIAAARAIVRQCEPSGDAREQ